MGGGLWSDHLLASNVIEQYCKCVKMIEKARKEEGKNLKALDEDNWENDDDWTSSNWPNSNNNSPITGYYDGYGVG